MVQFGYGHPRLSVTGLRRRGGASFHPNPGCLILEPTLLANFCIFAFLYENSGHEEGMESIVRKMGKLSTLHNPDLGQLSSHNKKYNVLTCDSLLALGLTLRARILHLKAGSHSQIH